ncbi:MAG: addiction module protein [Candidatus Hydrogenedentes bacterium]|nr:addiction module protein [Candidatus Hydrogenedentota bacterium]MBI3118335.1 addiction module protein [Candidatus Hydrogenedentota bacterium]
MATLNAVREEALALNPIERAGLIEDLLTSFDPASREAIDRAWAQEAERRIDAYKRGEAGAITLEESKRRLGAE